MKFEKKCKLQDGSNGICFYNIQSMICSNTTRLTQLENLIVTYIYGDKKFRFNK